MKNLPILASKVREYRVPYRDAVDALVLEGHDLQKRMQALVLLGALHVMETDVQKLAARAISLLDGAALKSSQRPNVDGLERPGSPLWDGSRDSAREGAGCPECASLRSKVEGLTEALKPFADMFGSLEIHWGDDDPLHIAVQVDGGKPSQPHGLVFGHLRRAHEAVAGEHDE